mmetsp:Transcript_54874/g.116580  ORF Transcript_54874/g.116580 Transcript_54874/m.116580 type:complete len:352 (-) Transcript_54874:753-1808(-)
MPHGIKTERVDRFALSILTSHLSHIALLWLITVECPTSPKQVQTKREAIIVHQTSIHSKESHHDNHITSHVQSSCHLIKLGLVILLLIPEQVQASAEEEQPMTNVAIHDPEQEREGGSREQSRIGLSVARNAVRVDKLLVPVGELVGGKVRGGRGPRLCHLVHVAGHVMVHIAVGAVHRGADVLEGLGDDPALTAEHARDVSLEHVEGVVDGLLAEDNPCPALRVLGEHLTEAETGVLILEEDGAGVDELLRIFGEHAINGGCIVHVREGVAMREERVANLLELCLNAERLEEDDEHALLYEAPRLGIRDGLLDGSEPDVAVAPCGPEDHTLEADLLLGGDNPSDGAEAHV